MNGAPLLRIDRLRTSFETAHGRLVAVNDVSVDVHRGQTLGLVGESGSGKSMLGFSIMNQLPFPGRIEAGSIHLAGTELTTLTQAQMRDIRGRRIAMIYQDPMMTLNPVLRIETQMTEAIHAHAKTGRAEARARARDMLGLVGIPSPDERLRAYPHEFSGGMRQRVAIAIALLNSPELIIADEPTTALDVTIQTQIIGQIQKLMRERHIAMIWISHDLSVVSRLADRIAIMYAGRIVETGAVRDVVHNPRHPYTRGLIDSVPSQNARGARLHQIPGTPPNMLALPEGCAFSPRCARRDEACAADPGATIEGDRAFRCHHPIAAKAALEVAP
ncbi:ABC transporter ATP-binding protein [Acuticoccus kandeliae]|uniref:ABC transporter ATP-binding protein n=1 Tax=Acuticoccus kandeliae TaxID=2073160 RepID=UPI000D3EB931|nr:ABC transporter ATP-binding protein [Acuticoccus kandeliae]